MDHCLLNPWSDPTSSKNLFHFLIISYSIFVLTSFNLLFTSVYISILPVFTDHPWTVQRHKTPVQPSLHCLFFNSCSCYLLLGLYFHNRKESILELLYLSIITHGAWISTTLFFIRFPAIILFTSESILDFFCYVV